MAAAAVESGLSNAQLIEVLEYEKILRIRDEIFAGTHPRLKLPVHLTGKVAPRPIQSPTVPSPRPPTAEAGIRSNPKVSTLRPDDAPDNASHHIQSLHPKTPAKTVSSDIDPILLTKSDDLVKAELQLQRQRVERILKEQVDQRRVDSKPKISGQEAVPDFDVSAVLSTALEIVKPVPASEGPHTTTASDSFDENSFYSSQQNDSLLSEDDTVQRPIPKLDQKEAARPAAVHDPKEDPRAGQVYPHLAEEDNHLHFNGSSGSGRPHGQVLPRDSNGGKGAKIVQSVDSSNYGGPDRHPRNIQDNVSQNLHSRADAGPSNDFRMRHDSFHFTNLEKQGSSQRNHEEMPPPRNGTPLSSKRRIAPVSQSSPVVPIIRNHILSPAAPQPARVSPLAVARMPAVAQIDRQLNKSVHQSGSGSQTPPSPAQLANPRKRRRALHAGDRPRKASGRRVVESPEPYIKQEPVSPPLIPLSEFRAPKRRQQSRIPLDIDQEAIESTVYRPHAALEHERQASTHRYERYAVESPRFADSSRIVPRSYMAGSVNSGAEIQGHARLPQHVRRLQSPPSYAVQHSPVESQRRRAPFHPLVRQSPFDESRPFVEDVRQYTSLYGQGERSRSPPPLRERLTPARYASTMMAPPTRKVGIDENGERFYTIPRSAAYWQPAAHHGRESVMGGAGGTNVEPYYERIRVPVPASERIYDDNHLVEERPLPQRAPNRPVMEPLEPLDYRSYRQRDYSTRPSELMIPRDEYVVRNMSERRQPSHFQDTIVPREHVQRIHSVRPESARYEMRSDHPPRVGNGYPGLEGREYAGSVSREIVPRSVREYSIRGEEPRREYLAAPNDERYAYLPPAKGMRYADESDHLERGPGHLEDLPSDNFRKTSYRYGAL
ncbi:MAG: hypothetical protein M1837_006856 [Sclerophora amabilis]|nr:MAG: hypothetical protein M1837_006856 [Sclerophora amabilis]